MAGGNERTSAFSVVDQGSVCRRALSPDAPIGWLAWPSISWLKLAGTDVQRGKKAYPTVLQVRRAAQVIACGALVDVRVVEVVASFGGIMACRRI
jgi:hypothetical protein